MQNCNISKVAMLQNHLQQPQNLTATASIERGNVEDSSHPLPHTQTGRIEQFQHQQQQQPQQPKSHQSLYGTLPYALPTIKVQRNNNNNSNNSRSMNGIATAGRGGVIQTISGTLPPPTTMTNTTDHNGNKSNSSLSSDLNGDLSGIASAYSNKLNSSRIRQIHKSREFIVTKPGGWMRQYQHQQQQQRPRQYASIHAQRYSNGGYLWILTPVAASISVAIVMAAISGPQWLFTEEKLPNANYNGTANFNMMDDGAYITKYTKSSLWILCTALQGVEKYNCIKIDYFPKEGYQPDPHDSTAAIPYTVTKSCPFFLAAGIFLLISFIIFLVPTCSHQNNLYYFSAGIMFIVSGLLMLIGLIAYISILKAEIGSKLRPRSSLQPALFKVTYGQSFFLFVVGFITTEFVGLLNIFLYISLQEIGYHNHLPCFNVTNLQGKLKEKETSHSHTYKSYKHSISSAAVAPIVRKPQRQQRGPRQSASNYHRQQIHNERLAPPPTEIELDRKKLLQNMPGSYVPCRRHLNSTEASFSNDLERRYYFAKTQQPKCNLHSKNLAKSLNELYTNKSAHALQPPPPSAIKMGGGSSQTLPRLSQQNGGYGEPMPGFPLTRSVSTTTDIFPTSTNYSIKATPHSERKSHRNMATNTRPFGMPLMTTTKKIRAVKLIESESERGGVCGGGTGDDDSEKERHQRRRLQPLADSQSSDSFYDDDDHGPQRLCGLRRGIRKTKDELFQEFCKRAGMRPKPKNIYFIASEEDAMVASDSEIQRQRYQYRGYDGTRRRVFGTGKDANDDDDDDDENEEENISREGQDDDEGEGGFSQLQDDEEHIYVIQDNSRYVTNPTYRNLRRSSMSVEPTHLRKLDSNLSLATVYPPEKQMQKDSDFGIERSDSAIEIWPPPPSFSNGESYYAVAKSAYFDSQNRLHYDYQPSDIPIYQSRTLPRSFLRGDQSNSQNSLGSNSLHLSASVLQNIYGGSHGRLSNLVMQQEQQQQQQKQPQKHSLEQQPNLHFTQLHAAGIYNSALALHKSNDELSSTNRQQQQQMSQNSTVHNMSLMNNTHRLQQPAIHWPAAIPSSPSGYATNYHQQMQQQFVAPTTTTAAATPRPSHPKAAQLAHTLLTRSFSSNASGGADSGIGSGGGGSSVLSVPPKFQRGYAFDEQRRPSALLVGEASETEGLEHERRRSHASIYSGISLIGGGAGGTTGSITNDNTGHYDYINGTAV